MNGHQTRRPAVFLDRDGTMNVERNYLYRREDWEWISGVPEALASLSQVGFVLVVVTNQSGIARGYYDRAAVDRLHAWVNADLAARTGVRLDGFYLCPHHPDCGSPCLCRKPAPGLLLRAAEDLGIDLSKSWMVGDKMSDVQAGMAAGCRSILVATGYGKTEQAAAAAAGIFVCSGLGEAARHILSDFRKEKE